MYPCAGLLLFSSSSSWPAALSLAIFLTDAGTGSMGAGAGRLLTAAIGDVDTEDAPRLIALYVVMVGV